VAALHRVQANLKRYRASVLKAACEGRLVPTEAELADHERSDSNLSTGTSLDLPISWSWTRLGELIEDGPQNGLYVPKTSYGSGTPIVRISDYQNGWSRPLDELQRVNLTAETAAAYRVRENDVLINRVNSLTHLGKVLFIRGHSEMPVFESNMMRLRLGARVVPRYAELYLQSSEGRARLIKGAKWAVNQASINQRDVRECSFPLPPLAEQHRIVAEADRRLSLIRVAEAQVTANLARAQRLRHSILQAAFASPASARQ
jgi:type I restriction enzyme S subunit